MLGSNSVSDACCSTPRIWLGLFIIKHALMMYRSRSSQRVVCGVGRGVRPGGVLTHQQKSHSIRKVNLLDEGTSL